MCNRCTYNFDHHCQWVSNDIGGKNYKDFVRMLVSVMATLLVQLTTISIHLVALSKTEESQLDNRKVYLVTSIVSIVLSVLLCLADIYLLSFHVYLITQHLSTYKYIRNIQNKGQSKVIK